MSETQNLRFLVKGALFYIIVVHKLRLQEEVGKYRISANSFRRNYSFLNLKNEENLFRKNRHSGLIFAFRG